MKLFLYSVGKIHETISCWSPCFPLYNAAYLLMGFPEHRTMDAMTNLFTDRILAPILMPSTENELNI